MCDLILRCWWNQWRWCFFFLSVSPLVHLHWTWRFPKRPSWRTLRTVIQLLVPSRQAKTQGMPHLIREMKWIQVELSVALHCMRSQWRISCTTSVLRTGLSQWTPLQRVCNMCGRPWWISLLLKWISVLVEWLIQLCCFHLVSLQPIYWFILLIASVTKICCHTMYGCAGLALLCIFGSTTIFGFPLHKGNNLICTWPK